MKTESQAPQSPPGPGPRRRYRFLSAIAEGAFGKVFLAEQITADGFSRVVAIKLLHSQWSRDSEVVARARDEARLLGRIRHENIVQVEDLTSIQGKAAIVMEYLEGRDLKALWHYHRADRSRFPLRALFEIGSSVASALHAAYHAVPLQGGAPLEAIHRDIKPSNIFLTSNGLVKLLDFGTARANFAEREAKTRALAFGSSGYIAPERVLGREDTPAADIFSLGVTLHEMITLELFGMVSPRPHKFNATIHQQVLDLDLPGDPAHAERIRALFRAMLSFEPQNRPTALDVVAELEALAAAAPDADLRRFSRTTLLAASLQPNRGNTGPDPMVGEVWVEDDPAAPPPTRGLAPIRPPPALRSVPPVAPRRTSFDVPRFVLGVLLGSLLLVSALGVVVGLAALTLFIGTRAS